MRSVVSPASRAMGYEEQVKDGILARLRASTMPERCPNFFCEDVDPLFLRCQDRFSLKVESSLCLIFIMPTTISPAS